MSSTTKWGWVNSGGEVQSETFGSPDAAIAEMQRRLGKGYDIERIAELGFKLAVVKVEISVIYTLDKHQKLTS